jgi:hypothetical protein
MNNTTEKQVRGLIQAQYNNEARERALVDRVRDIIG